MPVLIQRKNSQERAIANPAEDFWFEGVLGNSNDGEKLPLLNIKSDVASKSREVILPRC